MVLVEVAVVAAIATVSISKVSVVLVEVAVVAAIATLSIFKASILLLVEVEVIEPAASLVTVSVVSVAVEEEANPLKIKRTTVIGRGIAKIDVEGTKAPTTKAIKANNPITTILLCKPTTQ